MAIVKLGEWMALQAEKLMIISKACQRDETKVDALLSKQIELVRNCIDHNVPKICHDKFVNEAIRALSELFYKTGRQLKSISQRNVIGRMLETLATENLTCLSLDSMHMKIFGSSLCSKSHMFRSVYDLTIQLTPGVCDSSIKETHIIQLLQELHSLKKLSIDYCTDNILRCMSKNCKLIDKLNLNNSNINDNNINILSQLSNLKRVNLYATAVSQNGIETLLMSCKSIENIDTDTNFIPCAIEHILSFKENTGKQLKLKSYVNDAETTWEQSQLVVSMCPLIQKVMFTKYHTLQSHLKALNLLQDLRELKLSGYSFYEDGIKELLQIRGQNMVYLHLQRIDQIDINTLMFIARLCPNLQSLVIEKCIYVQQTMAYDLTHHDKTILEISPFKNLKTLSIGVNGGWPPTEELLLFLLTNCPYIEFVHVGGKLTTQTMLKVLEKNQFAYLKELRIWMCDKSSLSTLVIDKILQNCINFPEVLIY